MESENLGKEQDVGEEDEFPHNILANRPENFHLLFSILNLSDGIGDKVLTLIRSFFFPSLTVFDTDNFFFSQLPFLFSFTLRISAHVHVGMP